MAARPPPADVVTAEVPPLTVEPVPPDAPEPSAVPVEPEPPVVEPPP
ncbi:hypothetical protein [Streptomyces sp. NPDC017520]